MLNLYELEQLDVFAKYGTLSKAAQALHISQPTLTRTMQHLEDEFGVPLFTHGKNRLILNETGQKAVEYARELLADAENAVLQVRRFDQSMHTITVEACAPAPLWSLLPVLSEQFPDKTISSRITEIDLLVSHVKAKGCEIGILPYAIDDNDIECIPFIREELSVCLPNDHALAGETSITINMLNGYNCLLKSDIGFWSDICRQAMPASRFLVQTDEFEFEELTRTSTLPFFTTNLAACDMELLKNKVIVPISDDTVNVTFHMVFLKGNPGYRKAAERIARSNLHTL